MQLATGTLDIASPLHAAGSGKGPGLLKSVVKFEPDSLYILLYDIGDASWFHWGLYLAITANKGTVFHYIKGPQTGNQWEFQAKTRENPVPYSVNLLVGVKITDIPPCLHGPLAKRLANIHNSFLPAGQISCLEWVREALLNLDSGGYIKLLGDIRDLEVEAWMAAFRNRADERRTIIVSEFCV